MIEFSFDISPVPPLILQGVGSKSAKFGLKFRLRGIIMLKEATHLKSETHIESADDRPIFFPKYM